MPCQFADNVSHPLINPPSFFSCFLQVSVSNPPTNIFFSLSHGGRRERGEGCKLTESSIACENSGELRICCSSLLLISSIFLPQRVEWRRLHDMCFFALFSVK